MRPLVPGDTLALIAPAGPIPAVHLDAALPVLESWGLKVSVGPCVLSRHSTLDYLSATDAERAAEFTEAWLDPSVQCVLAARGGYGTQRMLDLIDWRALADAPPKIFAGSSDVTALHQAISAHLGLVSLFSPMPASPLFGTFAAEHLRQSLFEPEKVQPLSNPASRTLVPGRARGVLTGGNLALLAAGLGTPEQGSARGRIVLLEDVTESAYRLDRLLTQLLRAGWFDGVAGIVLGSWSGCGNPERVEALMLDRLGPLGVPMLADLGFGHVENSPTIPLGVAADLDATARTLTFRS
ncbi:LD-carboxypeptidase [Amycolatopsis sp. cg5]|uniref:S66 peptidase family protein n=1 Tax=Amycolatopsis sp. cg5 TaxID=3238802 RepID=UPI0035234B9F